MDSAKKLSCESQFIVTIHDIASKLERDSQVDIILLDFAKAFDKVPHHRLLHKLEYYGVNPKTNRWIRSFLENRKQSVILEGTVSMQVQVLSGVPQSTVLGPLLFLAYTNDMSEKQLHPRSNYLQMTAFFTVLLTTRLTVTYCRGTLQF